MASSRICFLVFNASLYIATLCRGFCLPEDGIASLTFGNSMFDVGNNNYINTTTDLQANFLPYVYRETSLEYPTGRPSEKLSKQIRQKLREVAAKKSLSRAVCVFSVGSNDYGTPFLTNSTSDVVLPYPQQEFVDLVVGNITATIKEIYSEGGRKFGFVNVSPLNCFPLLRRLASRSTITAGLEEEALALARLHNNALSKMLQKLEKQLKGFRYSITDLYGAVIELMKYPSKYGFEEGNAACCGGGPYRGDYSCGGKRGFEKYEQCNNVHKHVFFDCFHPTESAAEHFAKLMWSGNGDVTEPYNLKQLFDSI